MDNDVFEIGGKKLTSRLITGSGKYADESIIPAVLEAGGCDIITVALRRVDLDNIGHSTLKHIPKDKILLPNTSGARTSEEAIRIARLSRELGCGNWIKIEVINDSRYLLPDNQETLKAVEVLAKEGFVVLPYMSPELAAARRMADAGAAAIMPLGSFIGSNRGLDCRALIEVLIDRLQLPVIVDAGIGKPSQAADAMEMGAAAVLLNTAIASSDDPVSMAKAFKHAVIAGRLAYVSGMGHVRNDADASSPLTGFLGGVGE